MSDKIHILLQYLKTRIDQQRFSDRQVFENWQEGQIENFLSKILPVSGFYKQHFAGLHPSQWRSIPVVSKTELMKNFDSWNTAGINLEQAMTIAISAEESRNFRPMIGDISVGLSSGTSGNRGVFLVSRKERRAWSGAIIAKILPDCWRKPERIAFFLRANSNLYQTLSTGRWLRFQYFDLWENFESHVEKLNQYKPTVLAAPPSMLRILADAAHLGQLHIAPRKIIAVAEVLEPLDAAWIQEAFKQPVHQVYQATEGFLAATCRYGTLHLNEDCMIIEKEYLDEALGKFMPIITDFRRTTQPIIRYRLNDILTEKKDACPCGSVFTAIESIEGRCDDLFFFPGTNQEKLISIFPDFIRRAVMLSSSDISEYFVRQISPIKIEVSLRMNNNQSGIEHLIRTTFTDLCQQQNCQVPEVSLTPYVAENVPGRKLRRIQRTFEPKEYLV